MIGYSSIKYCESSLFLLFSCLSVIQNIPKRQDNENLKTRRNQEKNLKNSSWYQEIFPPGEKSKNMESPGKIRRFGSPGDQQQPPGPAKGGGGGCTSPQNLKIIRYYPARWDG